MVRGSDGYLLNFADKFRIFAAEGGQICLVFKEKSRISGRKITGLISGNLTGIMIAFFCQQSTKICACPLPSVLREREKYKLLIS